MKERVPTFGFLGCEPVDHQLLSKAPLQLMRGAAGHELSRGANAPGPRRAKTLERAIGLLRCAGLCCESDAPCWASTLVCTAIGRRIVCLLEHNRSRITDVAFQNPSSR
jgi:hypothetical protein